ncbi:hypothetical protein LINGRAHAP2_LOCUS33596 [Linum grandiflorum]
MPTAGSQPVEATTDGSSGRIEEHGPTSPTFKEKLLGSRKENMIIWNEFTLDEGVQARIKVTYVDNDRLKPRIEFDNDLEEELCHSWKSSLVIKVYGRSVGYYYLTNKLATMWNSMGEWEVLDVGNGFFVVKFHEEEDMIEALTSGPYNIGGSYLSIQRWTPDFFPSTARIAKIATWIKLTELPLHHYNDNSVYAIAQCIGTPLKLDRQTSLVSRGKYAWVCVIVDLDQPLLPAIGWKQFDIKVEYEGIPQICMSCGMAGHLLSSCPSRASQTSSPTRNQNLAGGVAKSTQEPNETGGKIFGEWMYPKRQGHRRNIHSEKEKQSWGKYGYKSVGKPMPDHGNTSTVNTPTSNSFNALYDETEMINEATTELHTKGDHKTEPTGVQIRDLDGDMVKTVEDVENISEPISIPKPIADIVAPSSSPAP